MKKDAISFSQIVKEELVNNTYESKDRLRALLSAYIRINATLSIRNKINIVSIFKKRKWENR